LYVPTLDQLNDPADSRPKFVANSEDRWFNFFFHSRLSQNAHMSLDQQISEGLVLDHDLKQRGPDFFRRRLSQFFNNELNRWRIYCLAKRWDNLSLWTNYASDHSGYCLEFANTGLGCFVSRRTDSGRHRQRENHLALRTIHSDQRW